MKCMKILLICLLVTTVVACHKSTEEIKLPGELQEVIRNTSCTCDPVLTKISLQDNIYYVMTWSGPACSYFPVYYNEDGNHIDPPVTVGLYAAKVIEIVWKCKHR